MYSDNEFDIKHSLSDKLIQNLKDEEVADIAKLDDQPPSDPTGLYQFYQNIPLRLVACMLRTNCGGSFDPESRKDALCRRESLICK